MVYRPSVIAGDNPLPENPLFISFKISSSSDRQGCGGSAKFADFQAMGCLDVVEATARSECAVSGSVAAAVLACKAEWAAQCVKQMIVTESSVRLPVFFRRSKREPH